MAVTLTQKCDSNIRNTFEHAPLTIAEASKTAATDACGANETTGKSMTSDELILKTNQRQKNEKMASIATFGGTFGGGFGMILLKSDVAKATGGMLMVATPVVAMVAGGYNTSSLKATAAGIIGGVSVGLGVGIVSRNPALSVAIGSAAAAGLVGMAHLVRNSRNH